MRKPIGVFLSAAALLLPPALASADITSDHPGAILIFPNVIASVEEFENADNTRLGTTDTVVQISNTSTDAVNLHCFYVEATGQCSLSGFACDPDFRSTAAPCPLAQDHCLPRWIETDFDVVLTPRQPLAWSALRGLQGDDLPLNGIATRGPNGENNAGTLVPPVHLEQVFREPDTETLSIFHGELKCVVVDDAGNGAPRNVVKGEATTVSFVDSTGENRAIEVLLATAKYNAIAIKAIDGDANGDGVLELGGGANEYNGCPNMLILQHFFDGADFDNIGAFDRSETRLTLVPCTQDFLLQIPGSTTLQFLVFNEFEQRFSTSARLDCLFRRTLSDIDTNQPERSIFNIAVAGTLAGQTRIRGVNQGILGIAGERYQDFEFVGERSDDDAFNLGTQGDRENPDRITIH